MRSFFPIQESTVSALCWGYNNKKIICPCPSNPSEAYIQVQVRNTKGVNYSSSSGRKWML